MKLFLKQVGKLIKQYLRQFLLNILELYVLFVKKIFLKMLNNTIVILKMNMFVQNVQNLMIRLKMEWKDINIKIL